MDRSWWAIPFVSISLCCTLPEELRLLMSSWVLIGLDLMTGFKSLFFNESLIYFSMFFIPSANKLSSSGM